MYIVGRIDREKFKAISQDITTDEVIITDERIAHIEARHPGDFQKYGQYIPEILSRYNYMLKDELPNTALLLKRLHDVDGAIVELVLRLHTSSDDPKFSNSVLSLWSIGEGKYHQYERNKNILDKQE